MGTSPFGPPPSFAPVAGHGADSPAPSFASAPTFALPGVGGVGGIRSPLGAALNFSSDNSYPGAWIEWCDCGEQPFAGTP